MATTSKFIEFLKKNNALQEFVNNIKTYSISLAATIFNSKEPEEIVQAYTDRVDEMGCSMGISLIPGIEIGPKTYISMAFSWSRTGNREYWSSLEAKWLQELEGSEVQNKAEAIKQWFKDQGLDEILRQEQEHAMQEFFGEEFMKQEGVVESMDDSALQMDLKRYPLTTFVLSKSIKGSEFWREKLLKFEDWKRDNRI